eukprot:3543315-Rhodomonas_salina.1
MGCLQRASAPSRRGTPRNQMQETAFSVQFVPGVRFHDTLCWVLAYGSCLRACYAMCGTDVAYGSMCLRFFCVMPGTGIWYRTMCLRARCHARY